MGQMTIIQRGDLHNTPPTNNGEVGSIIVNETACQGEYSISVIADPSVWVEFDISSAAVVVTKIGGTFVNGEQILVNTEYRVIMNGFESPSPSANSINDYFRIRTKLTSSGSVIDQMELDRSHTGDLC